MTFTFSLNAQMVGEVKGTVKDASNGELLTGVALQVEGLKLGGVTNANGEFTIRRLPYGKVRLLARLVGYKAQSVEVVVGEEPAMVMISLAPTAVTSDEIIVTGQGAAIQKKALPYTVESISSEQINRPGITSVDQALQGQIPGLSAFNATGIPGTGARIQTRGIKSALSNTTPVIYVDGVRVDAADNFRLADGTGGATSSSLADLVTGDIERIEVIKGGAASALYGAEAANGVIQIFTKKGRPGEAKIRFQHQSGADLPETKFVFEDRTKDLLYRTAYFNRNAINITGGSEALTYNASGSIQYANGIFVQDELSNQLYNMTGGIKAILSSKSDLEFFANLTRNQFGRAAMANAYDVSPLTFLEAGSSFAIGNYVAPEGDIDPNDRDAVRAEFLPRMLPDFRTVTNRVTSGLILNVSPVSEWSNRFTLGIDYRKSEERNFIPIESVLRNVYSVSSQDRSDREFLTLTIEYAGSYKLPELADAVTQTIAFGGRGFRIEDRESFISGQNFTVPGTTEINNATTITAGESNRALFNGGFWLQDQIGISDILFINLAGRLDINTTFGTEKGIQFFPTIGAAYNLSDLAFFEDAKAYVSSMKLRASWGQAGNFAPNPFARDKTFILGRFNATQSGLTFGNPGNRDLGPEITTSFDAGADIGVWDDRVSFEFSYYNQTTNSSLLNKPEDPAGGKADQVRNVGQINNNGIELALRALVIRDSDVELSLRASFTTVNNKLVNLGGAAPFTIGGFAFLPMRAEEGFPLGVYRVNIPRDVNGNRIDGPVPAGGFGEFDGDFEENVLFGTPTPTFFGSFGFDLTLFKDFTISAFGEFATGHFTLNQALDTRFYQGYNDIVGSTMDDYSGSVAVNNWQRGFLPNDNYVTDNATVILIEKANWFKIREISARYRLPNSLLEGVNVSLSVRNPFIFGTRARGIDPELATVRAGGALDLGGVGNLAVSAPIQWRFTVDWSF